MDSTLKRATERALQPAIEHINQQIPFLRDGWPEHQDAQDIDDVPADLVKPHIVNRMVAIVALRRGRTLTESEKQDVREYAETLV